MVYFECQKCNETVKKPKLAKHLQSCGSHFVSCIDCSKVFGWDEWESHTSCMSEAQKYQGNLYQAKEKENKGQVKQDTWTENIRKAIEDPGGKMDSQTKSNLQKLLGFDNIPRKPKPFANFVKNSVKVWDQSKIDDMWSVIAAATGKTSGGGGGGAAAAAPGDKAPAAAQNGWAGWKRALDDELKAAGGSLPWKKLCTRLVQQFREKSGTANGESEADLEVQALASIPEGYCSPKNAVVKIP
eukprot:TRINITY_DN107196_c0_g1_i1.p1 TRINITY_DN107196_c0_g1~~TRINITY_DN107196_c0_g1_i1.p1  ORF type:complete len:242 (+),score=68.91 TRINITY_DN107196_c0_g1_i1:40-765(+)